MRERSLSCLPARYILLSDASSPYMYEAELWREARATPPLTQRHRRSCMHALSFVLRQHRRAQHKRPLHPIPPLPSAISPQAISLYSHFCAASAPGPCGTTRITIHTGRLPAMIPMPPMWQAYHHQAHVRFSNCPV
jgi:hypothetical protein